MKALCELGKDREVNGASAVAMPTHCGEDSVARSGEVQYAEQRERQRNQEALARLSPLGERVIAKRSAHFPQMSEPQVVLEALSALIRRTKC